MKNTRPRSILSSGLIAFALTLGSLASTQAAFAQTTVMRVKIPFTFQTSLQTLPAGTYSFYLKPDHLVWMQGDESTGGFVMTHDADKPHVTQRGSLVFHRYGDKYYLSQIWKPGTAGGYDCLKSPAEKKVLHAKNAQPPSMVELALSSAPKH